MRSLRALNVYLCISVSIRRTRKTSVRTEIACTGWVSEWKYRLNVAIHTHTREHATERRLLFYAEDASKATGNATHKEQSSSGHARS